MTRTRRPFNKYKHKILVETGTYLGDGVSDALKNNFEKVISFEIVKELHSKCVEKFKYNKNVKLIHGSSATLLYDAIKDIDTPITFWLDGHYSMGITGYDKQYVCPLMEELNQIGKHHIKTHTILIDDRRLMKKTGNNEINSFFEITEEEVIEKLKSINSNYKIKYEDGHIPNDILVATV